MLIYADGVVPVLDIAAASGRAITSAALAPDLRVLAARQESGEVLLLDTRRLAVRRGSAGAWGWPGALVANLAW